MADRLRISRRDFINGIALGVAAGGTLSPVELMAMAARTGEPYPPALTGMRGAHPGSYDVAHALAWQGKRWPRPDERTDDVYDLVVVGGGISGLAAAFLYRQRAGGDRRVLVLDNHDDFGGHAKRNEFTVDGKRLIGYGGSQSIDTPGHYSAVARRLLEDLGVDVQRFYDWFDREYYARRRLVRGIYFGAGAYGEDRVAPNVLRRFDAASGGAGAAIRSYPLPEPSRAALERLLESGDDPLAGRTREERIALLRKTSYSDFLRRYAGMPEDVVLLLRDTVKGLWGVGWDALSALEAWRGGMPGTAALGIGELEGEPPGRDEPYIFHFPDGNAGIARALVSRLVPDAVAARNVEDLVTARVHYGQLDRPGSAVRIRLNSTAVEVRNAHDGAGAEVTYVRDGRVERVVGRHVVLACWNRIIPYLCPELPQAQREAIEYATKVPLVYLSIAVRNWRAFERLGYHDFYVPRAELMHSFGMDFPVSIGHYRFTREPDEPTVIHGTFVPTQPDAGLTAREQHVAGRRRLLEMSFEDFERGIVSQMSGALGAGGFDPERDIAAITVNRWPHGYAYEYNDYSDPPEWGPEAGPHVAGRARIGRISIANSDASAYAYVNGAIDAADRAVNEQLALA